MLERSEIKAKDETGELISTSSIASKPVMTEKESHAYAVMRAVAGHPNPPGKSDLLGSEIVDPNKASHDDAVMRALAQPRPNQKI